MTLLEQGKDYAILEGPSQPKQWHIFVYCAVFCSGRHVAWVLDLLVIGMCSRKERREM